MDAGTPGNVDLLMRLMSASTERARVASSNIANASTPGYRRQVVQFENILRDRIAEGATLEDLAGIQPAVVEDTLTPSKPDGNNVTLELEINTERQNRLLYETYAALLQSHFDMIETSIQSGR
ncbi:MAG: flagellar basal body rod protein FlgB [Planctomycetaceae bacterium]|jgi:flagellar basal-body rod protein FlgB|nr:flagellar basal body rod protein FlgB [Planctomycetaceae bacterium]